VALCAFLRRCLKRGDCEGLCLGVWDGVLEGFE